LQLGSIYVLLSQGSKKVGRDSSVGIGTRYGLDALLGERIYAPVQTGPRVHLASYAMGTESFPGVKRPGCGDDHQPHLSPRL